MTVNAAGMTAVVAAYVCGSIPTAYLAGRWLKRVDLRTVGSGNLGATNVYRELGTVPATVVLIVDVLKGLLPTLFFPAMAAARFQLPAISQEWAIACGAAAILGHTRPIFLLWRGGGKGVATAAGVFLALSPGPTALCILTFIIVLATTRFVSLSSIVATAALPIFEWFNSHASALFFTSLAVATFVTWAHRANIGRIRAGTEPRIRRPGGDRQ